MTRAGRAGGDPDAPIPGEGSLARARRWLAAPVDRAGVEAFRILFGLLLAVGAARTIWAGWIPQLYAEPRFFFKFWGFEWVRPWPLPWMYVHYAALAALGLAIAAGFHTRVSALLFFLGFTYVQLVDVTNYLNHHYLVSLLALLVAVLPLGRDLGIDAWRRPARRAATVPRWVPTLLRFQVGVVYVYAGLAKLSSDWLLGAQPLNIWLSARSETPLVGPWLDEVWVAYAASWGAFLYDLTIPFWLLWRRSRPFAFVVLLVFHGLTHLWFNIGMFPFIMTIAATVFFDTAWPRRLLRLTPPGPAPAPHRGAPAPALPHPALGALLGAFVLVQALVPLRHLAYPGDVLWTEEGMRFSWKVMVREKHGAVTFHVHLPETGRSIQVSPRRYLTAKQEREMGGQPDLILQLARHIARELEAKGHKVEVRAEALVSLNGRPASLLLDPTRDLARVEDGLGIKDWIRPAPAGQPPTLKVASW